MAVKRDVLQRAYEVDLTPYYGISALADHIAMWLLMDQNPKVYYLRKPLYHFRRNEGSVTTESTFFADCLSLFLKYFPSLLEKAREWQKDCRYDLVENVWISLDKTIVFFVRETCAKYNYPEAAQSLKIVSNNPIVSKSRQETDLSRLFSYVLKPVALYYLLFSRNLFFASWCYSQLVETVVQVKHRLNP